VIELAISLLAIPVLFAFAQWRLGLLLALATAILQDPLRKITPDQPVLFVGFVGIVFAAACLGASVRGVPLTPNSIFGGYRRIAVPISLLLLLIILQAFNSYVRFGNPMISLLGLLTYLLPLPSVVFGYQLVLRGGEARIYQFIRVYLLCTVLALTTVYLEYAGYNWPVLGPVGTNLSVFDLATGQRLVLNSGIFRAPEIAAWHAMACACFVMLLTAVRKVNYKTLFTAAVIITLVIAIGALTGRRKALIMIAVFASTYLILWAMIQKGAAKLGIALAIAGALGFGWLVGQLPSDRLDSVSEGSSGYSLYVERSKSVFKDAPSRFTELGIAPIMWAYDGFGLFGAGLGVGTQGTQYFGGGGEGAAEGGLGKITLELGIPGLFIVGWLGISVFSHLWQIMRASSRISPRIARLSYGLFSFLVANAAGFSVATQAYGDLFILMILSWTLGFLLAVPLLLEREVRARQPAIFEELAPVFRPKTV
jgi:hypothetical protein